MCIYVIIHIVFNYVNISLLLSLSNSTKKIHTYLMVAEGQ